MSMTDLITALQNPLFYETEVVRRIVPAGAPGVYVLIRRGGQRLSPVYVGRSDRCLRSRLLRHPYREPEYFAFAVCRSPLVAYLAERRAYWWLRPVLNEAFPALPDGYGGIDLRELSPILRFSKAHYTTPEPITRG
jgi:hypothetical protein